MQYKTKEEQLQVIHNSSEYKEYMKHNAKNIEKIKSDDIDGLCNYVGYWNYMQRACWSQERELDNLYLNSRVDIVLNKNQEIYPLTDKNERGEVERP
jgi:hypothetical protein